MNSTFPVGGETVSGLPLLLALPRAANYAITAHLSALQVAVSASWSLLATYTGSDSGLAFNTPAQVAVGPDGSIFVADTANNRLVKLDSSGAYVSSISGLAGVRGVALDSSSNIYVTWRDGAATRLSKYNSSHVSQYAVSIGNTAALPDIRHLCTDGTHVYLIKIATFDHHIDKRLCSTGASVGVLSTGIGSSDGQFDDPWGIATDGTHLYVADRDNSRIQKLTTAGVFVAKWGNGGSGDGQFNAPRGIALDDSGDVWVADYGNDRLQQFTNTGTYLQSIAQADPDGVGMATGDVLWVSNAVSDDLAKWDETGGGYGEVAIDIGGSVSAYVGPGNRVAAIANVHTATVSGPGEVLIRPFGRATAGTMTLQGLVLSATAVPDR